jgi:hypothetical protein
MTQWSQARARTRRAPRLWGGSGQPSPHRPGWTMRGMPVLLTRIAAAEKGSVRDGARRPHLQPRRRRRPRRAARAIQASRRLTAAQPGHTLLDRDLAEIGAIPKDERTVDEQTRYDNARAADRARNEIESQRDPRTNEKFAAQIYMYDPMAFGGDGAVAMAIGDL